MKQILAVYWHSSTLAALVLAAPVAWLVKLADQLWTSKAKARSKTRECDEAPFPG